ncbi:MAG: hypothetical protein ACREGJ_00245 [Candidatus Saccharimonadales bacterium]
MFRKLVSSLPFSPALVGQLGFYARRLRKEQATRRLGLIFTALAIVVQSFAVFSPPEQAVASSGSDIIKGGVSSVQEIMNVYDAGAKGQNDFKDLMDYVGITRSELAKLDTKVVYVCSSDHSIISFGRQHRYSTAEGELAHKVPRQTGGFSTFYSVPLYRFDDVNNRVNCYDSYIGHSAKMGWFSIMRKCGNLQIKHNVTPIPKAHFITASCKTIQGYAYDERQKDLRVKVYLFFDGPPGKGKQYGPIVADQATPNSPLGGGYGFNFSVPAEYQKLNRPVTVWGVMQPLPGWDQPTVQFDNTVSIPGNCVPTQTPLAQCSALKVNLVDRTRISLSASARAEQGASITGYTYIVTDKSGKKIYEKFVTSSSLSNTSEIIDLRSSGDYTARVVVKTSLGDRESADCTKPVRIASVDKCKYNPTLPVGHPDCQPCPYEPTLWLKDEDCVSKISQSKEAKNLSQKLANANGTTAQASDRIEFTIYTTNLSGADTTTKVEENLSDVLEYANLIDSGGGTFDEQKKIISWGDVKLGAQGTDTRRFVVQLKEVIPATPRAANDPASYNCVMTNSYGNTIDINVQCPPEKAVESAVKQLPSTGPGANMIFAGSLLMTVTYFFARSKQMNKEVRIIRKEFNTGTI